MKREPDSEPERHREASASGRANDNLSGFTAIASTWHWSSRPWVTGLSPSRQAKTLERDWWITATSAKLPGERDSPSVQPALPAPHCTNGRAESNQSHDPVTDPSRTSHRAPPRAPPAVDGP